MGSGGLGLICWSMRALGSRVYFLHAISFSSLPFSHTMKLCKYEAYRVPQHRSEFKLSVRCAFLPHPLYYTTEVTGFHTTGSCFPHMDF